MRNKLILYSVLAFALAGCGNSGSATATKPRTYAISNAIDGSAPPQSNGSGSTGPTGPSGLPPGPPLQFQVNGVGNHARHICVPAVSKLNLRIVPHANYLPLLPAMPTPTYPGGGAVYDGSPAYYSKLRVRLSIPGTVAAWDYLANLETNSVIGDYTSYLRAVSGTSVPTTSMLTTPEYTNTWILGSSSADGLCTYWEQQLGKCTAVSSQLRTSETASCAAGEQKILITSIVSDFPCTYDRINWCQGGSIQTVPDYQSWSLTVQAATEKTQSF